MGNHESSALQGQVKIFILMFLPCLLILSILLRQDRVFPEGIDAKGKAPKELTSVPQGGVTS